MANNSGNSSNTAFSGFPGGHDSGKTSFGRLEFLNYETSLFYLVPGVGDIAPATTGTASTGIAGAGTLGANLPHVDPNTFQGTVHWGPDQALAGPPPGLLPPGGGAAGASTGFN